MQVKWPLYHSHPSEERRKGVVRREETTFQLWHIIQRINVVIIMHSFLPNSIKVDCRINVPETIRDLCWWLRFSSLWNSQFQLPSTIDTSFTPATFHSPFCSHLFSLIRYNDTLQLQQRNSFQLSPHALLGLSSGFSYLCSLCLKLYSLPLPTLHMPNSGHRIGNHFLWKALLIRTQECVPAPYSSNTPLWPSSRGVFAIHSIIIFS